MNKKFVFSKKFRLLKTIDFKKIYYFSYKVENKGILILGHKNIFNYPRLGLSISKKVIKKSVFRNQLKRLIREFFRCHKNFLLCMDFLIILKKNFVFNKSNFLLNLKIAWKRYYR